MKIFYKSFLFKLPILKEYEAIVLGTFCFFKEDKNNSIEQKSIIVHELVHQEQMKKFGLFGFYLIYIHDYLINLIKYKNHEKAYYNIPFEMEAYRVQEEYISKVKNEKIKDS